MTTEEDVSKGVDPSASRRRTPQVGDHVSLRGRPGIVVDVAEYSREVCQVVVDLGGPPGRPPVSVLLEDLDPEFVPQPRPVGAERAGGPVSRRGDETTGP